MTAQPCLLSDLVGNPEDQFSHNKAHIGTDNTAKMHRLNCAVAVCIMQIFDFITSSSTNLCSIKCNIDFHIIVLSTMISTSHIIRKPVFANAKTKMQISCVVTAQLIGFFVFTT